MPTIREIAKAAGCSTATVSKAMNGYPHVNSATREKILSVARELGFTPNYFAKSLMTKRSYLIGILMVDYWRLGIVHPLFGGMIEGFKSKVESRGYELLIIKNEYTGTNANFVEHCLQRGIEGVFLVITNGMTKCITELAKSNLPCVSVDLRCEGISTVLTDNEKGGYDAVNHLISLGHSKIAHIAVNDDKPAGRDRLEGYRRAMESAGFAFDPELVQTAANFSPQAGTHAMSTLLARRDDITAVFASSDVLAFGAVAALRERGISVPEQMSVIGFDDIDTAIYFSPPLTTMRQNRAGIGHIAGDIMVDLIENQSLAQSHLTLPAELVLRGSTAPQNMD